jgi:2-dehydro-3-deoxyphosphogalactonate aldolase
MRAVLLTALRIYTVGGLDPDNMADWRAAGASGFGVGSAVFTPGRSAADVGMRAGDIIRAWRAGAARRNG